MVESRIQVLGKTLHPMLGTTVQGTMAQGTKVARMPTQDKMVVRKQAQGTMVVHKSVRGKLEGHKVEGVMDKLGKPE